MYLHNKVKVLVKKHERGKKFLLRTPIRQKLYLPVISHTRETVMNNCCQQTDIITDLHSDGIIHYYYQQLSVLNTCQNKVK